MPPGGPGQYPGPRGPMLNHASFPPYQQNWCQPTPPPPPQQQQQGSGNVGSPNLVSNLVQQTQTSGIGCKSGPQSQQQLNNTGSISTQRPINYLKQHLQHKSGYTGAQSPTPPPPQLPPQGYGNGPGMHPPMPPPHHMGPPMNPTNMGPPSSAPQNQQQTPPPPPQTQQQATPPSPQSTQQVPIGANSHTDNLTGSTAIGSMVPHPEGVQDNGLNSSNSSSASSHQHPVTSIVTTGPDGTPLDEASQQSTLSNASAASGEDPQCSTPKSSRKSGGIVGGGSGVGGPDHFNQSHLAPPSASPGAHQQHEDFEIGSPSWTRTPASPVFNSHVPQETFRSSKV